MSGIEIVRASLFVFPQAGTTRSGTGSEPHRQMELDRYPDIPTAKNKTQRGRERSVFRSVCLFLGMHASAGLHAMMHSVHDIKPHPSKAYLGSKSGTASMMGGSKCAVSCLREKSCCFCKSEHTYVESKDWIHQFFKFACPATNSVSVLRPSASHYVHYTTLQDATLHCNPLRYGALHSTVHYATLH